MKTLALAMAFGLCAAGASTAQADHNCGGYGGGFGFYGGYGGGFGGGYVSQPYYGHLHHNVNPYTATYGGGHLHWHDTSHFDYVQPRFTPHGNHYHYQPGGYIYHQDGHFDLHH